MKKLFFNKVTSYLIVLILGVIVFGVASVQGFGSVNGLKTVSDGRVVDNGEDLLSVTKFKTVPDGPVTENSEDDFLSVTKIVSEASAWLSAKADIQPSVFQAETPQRADELISSSGGVTKSQGGMADEIVGDELANVPVTEDAGNSFRLAPEEDSGGFWGWLKKFLSQ